MTQPTYATLIIVLLTWLPAVAFQGDTASNAWGPPIVVERDLPYANAAIAACDRTYLVWAQPDGLRLDIRRQGADLAGRRVFIAADYADVPVVACTGVCAVRGAPRVCPGAAGWPRVRAPVHNTLA